MREHRRLEGITMRFDTDFVRYWSVRYVNEEISALETELLNTVHAAIETRGYLTSDELEKIVRWKSARTLGKPENSPDTIKDVTRIAFNEETPDWMRHHILCVLMGIRHPMASAILTVRYPQTHTVIDKLVVRAVRKLRKLGLLNAKPPSDTNYYWTYLDRARKATLCAASSMMRGMLSGTAVMCLTR
jgi:hypothetical protein